MAPHLARPLLQELGRVRPQGALRQAEGGVGAFMGMRLGSGFSLAGRIGNLGELRLLQASTWCG